MKQIVTGTGLALIVLTLLPFIRSERWWIRMWDFPRLQLAAGLLAVLTVYVWLCTWTAGEWFLSASLTVCFVYQMSRIFNYTPLAPVQTNAASPDSSPTWFSLMVSNVRMDNRNADGFLAVVRANDPDVVLVNEPDHWWAQRLEALDSDYPYQVKIPQDNTYGMILYSRLPLRRTKTHYLVDTEIPSIQAWLEIPSGDVVELFAVHPRPPLPDSDTGERDAELLIVGRMVRLSPEPSIVAGDMNDVAWSYTTRLFQRISGLLDPRAGRGMYNTFNAFIPVMRWPLDHIFHAPAFRLVELRRLDNFGSDHFPIFVRLSYEPNGREQQKLPPPNAEERREAKYVVKHVIARRSAF